MPNRLQANWNTMKPRILKHWDKLADADLRNVDGRFDRFIQVIRKRYKPGRSSITVEAKIYDWLFEQLHDIEKEGDE